MSVQSIEKAYSQYGPEGLTEKGNDERLRCIATAATGTALVIGGIVIFILCLPHFGLFPAPAAPLGGCFGFAILGAAGIPLIIYSADTLNRSRTAEYINPSPPAKHPQVQPDPRGKEL